MLLKELYNRGPRLYPGKVGLVDGQRHFTYREVGERCNRLARRVTMPARPASWLSR